MMSFADINWIAVLVAVIAAQIVLTLWFTVLFGDAWARAYGAKDRAEHTSQVPPWTYGIGLACAILLTLGIAWLQAATGISGVGAGLGLGLTVAILFCIPAVLPGYAFLKKMDAGTIAAGSQAAAAIVISVVLAAFG